MSKVLLITNSNMSLQSGNVVLLTRRAEELYRQFGIGTICIVINPKLANISISHKTEGITFYLVSNKKELHEYLIKHEYKTVFFYGIISYLYVDYVKKILSKQKTVPKLLMDVQGCLEEQIEYPGRRSIIVNYTSYYVKKYILCKTINKVDGTVVVTEELSEHLKPYLGKERRHKFEFFKIRCGVNEVINEGYRMKWRSETRSRWNISDNTMVMVYSGYRMAWQNMDKIIQSFQELDQRGSDVYFAFFCDIDNEFQDRINKAFPRKNYILEFLSFEDYFKNLCACDVGFLIRDYNTTNRVAFPNKFSDYINAGLLIAISDALPEPVRILHQYEMTYIDVEKSKREDIFSKCSERQTSLSEYYGKCNEICAGELLFSNQIYKSNLGAFINGENGEEDI